MLAFNVFGHIVEFLLRRIGRVAFLLFLIIAKTGFSKTLKFELPDINSRTGQYLERGDSFQLRSANSSALKVVFDQSLNLSQIDRKSWDGGIEFSGIPLCHSHLKATKLRNGKILVLGNILDVSNVDLQDLYVYEPDLDLMDMKFRDYLHNNDFTLSSQVVSQESCLSIFENEFHMTQRFQFQIGKGLFEAMFFADQLHISEKTFHVAYDTTARVEVYPNRILDGIQSTFFEIDNMSDSGKLESKRLTMLNSPMSVGGDFSFDESSNEFAQASIFYWADKHLDFLESIGYVDYNNQPIQITYPDTSNSNNAAYRPKSGSSNPQILIGVGSGGSGLVSLGLDEDVISHELGHHAIYEYINQGITSTSEATLLHEALSDFFVNERTGDGCIGESICPENSSVCFFKSQDPEESSCLRHTAISFKYMDSAYNSISSIHEKSQIVSAMLERFSKSITAGTAAELVYKSLALVPANSNIEAFLYAMFHVDLDEYEGLYRENIREAADFYGLQQFTKNIPTDVKESLPYIEEIEITQDTGVVAKVEQKSSKSSKEWWHFGCSISSHTSGHGSNPGISFLILFLILPLLCLIQPRFKAIAVKIKKMD